MGFYSDKIKKYSKLISADETNFEFNNKFVKFDGTVGLRTKVTYPSNVKEVTPISPIYESDAINVSDYKTFLKIEV